MNSSIGTRPFLYIVLAAGGVAAVHMALFPGKPSLGAFAALLFFACASAPLKIRLPGADRVVSLSLFFRLAAIIELPAGGAILVVVVAMLYEVMLDSRARPRWNEVAFDLACASVAAWCSYAVYTNLNDEVTLRKLLLVGLAAATYYAVTTGLSSVYLALRSGTHPWKVWHETFFWSAPLYMLPALGLDAWYIFKNAPSPVERVLTLALALAGYAYVKRCFARLHDQGAHAREMDEIRQRAIEALAVAIETKEGGTAAHLQRLKRLAARLARKLNFSEMDMQTLELAAVLHDVGKVGVPDFVLSKPGRLNESEFRQMTIHPTVGAEIVSAIRFPGPVTDVVLSHHEHWDGSGYPRGLSGTEIPPLARLLAVVDCFDALITDRPYRSAVSIDQATQVLSDESGKLLDPEMVDAFLNELPSFAQELDADLAAERSNPRPVSSPQAMVRQTWIADAEKAIRRHRGDQQPALEQLASEPERLLCFYEILRQDSLRQTLLMLQRVIPYDKAGVFVREGEAYVLFQGAGIPNHCLSRLAMPASCGVVGRAAAAGRPVVVEGPATTSFVGQALHYFDDIRSALAAPLTEGGKQMGAIVLGSTVPGAFDDNHAQFIALVTEKLAGMITSALHLQRLRPDATRDPVTGLPGCAATFEKLETEIADARQKRRSVAVLYLDLDGFQKINEIHGHVAGDELLIHTAETLKSSLRATDFVGRVGADEFVAIMPGLNGQNLRRKVEDLQRTFAANLVVVCDGARVQTTAGLGAASYPDDGLDAESLLSHSEREVGRGPAKKACVQATAVARDAARVRLVPVDTEELYVI